MTSRSTRRKVKSTELSNMDKCQTDDDSKQEENSNVGKRRSLRHNPGSTSISPPRKTRRLRVNSISVENRVGKDEPCLSKLKTMNSDEYDELQNTIPFTSQRTTRNSSLDNSSSNSRCIRNATFLNSSKKNSACKTSQNDFDKGSIFQRTTRSKVNISFPTDQKSEKNEFNAKLEPTSILSKSRGSVNYTQVHSDDDPTSHSQFSKSSINVSNSTDSPTKTNGSNVKSFNLSKLKCTLSSCNVDDINSALKSSNASSEDDLSCTHTRHNINNHQLNSKTDLPLDNKSSVKRKLNNKLDDENIQNVSKKSRILKSSLTSSLSNKEANGHFLKSDNFLKSSEDLCNYTEELDKAATLIKGFGLTKDQCMEIYDIIPINVRDSSDVEIIKFLARKLLKDVILVTSMQSPRLNKFLRQLLAHYCNCDTTVENKHKLCESAVEWSKERRSINLQHELELALMTLYCNTGFYRKAEQTASALFKETKKLQDKEKTVKACLCLSKCYHSMGNLSKARANITTAKTEALKIYTPPHLQAELDLQSGIMQVAEEKDMETAFSYFKEAAFGFPESRDRSKALKYMLLTKLLINKPEEGEKSIRSESHVKDVDEGVEAMLAITKAAMSSSLAEFKKQRSHYHKELEEDSVVKGVLDHLYGKMLRKNLLNIVTPYERLQISVIAEKICLERTEVERRLSQMILDGEISAQLDHRDDCLYVYQPETRDIVYKHGIDSISQLDRTLSLLNRKVKQIL